MVRRVTLKILADLPPCAGAKVGKDKETEVNTDMKLTIKVELKMKMEMELKTIRSGKLVFTLMHYATSRTRLEPAARLYDLGSKRTYDPVHVHDSWSSS
jgi:hypothetical protein